MISLSEFLNHTFLNWSTGKVVYTMWLWHVPVNLSKAVVVRSSYFRESFREHWGMSFGSHLGCLSLSEFLNHTFLNWTTGKVVHTMWLWHVSVNLSEAVVVRSTYFRESFREHWGMSFRSHLGCLSVGILPCILKLIFKQCCDGLGAISGAPLVSSLVGS